MPDVVTRRLSTHSPLGEGDGRALGDAVTRTLEFAGGDEIVGQATRPSECHVLLGGMAASSKRLPSGDRQIVKFASPGDFLDLDALTAGRMDYAVTALGPCKVGVIPHEALRDLMRARPALADALWRQGALDAAIYREWVVNVGHRLAPERIAHVTCEVFSRLDEVGETIEVKGDMQFSWPVTQGDIADATGLSTVHVNRTLQDLRGRELIRFSAGRMTIRDWAALKQLAGFEADYLRPAAQPVASGRNGSVQPQM